MKIIVASILILTLSSEAYSDTFNTVLDFERQHPDLACDVDQGPLDTPPTSEQLKALSNDANGQEKLDQIYAKLTAGTMPQGFYQGSVIFAKSANDELIKSIAHEVFKVKGGDPRDAITKFAETLWKGKKFKADPYAHPNPAIQTRILGNKIPITDANGFLEDIGLRVGGRGEGGFFSSVASGFSKFATRGWNEWRFPAKVYCGQSLIDSRRESVIIDYAMTSDFKRGYDKEKNRGDVFEYKVIDALAGPSGLKIRDEIRMVKPGLYLGRAYLDRVFLLNFLLECQEGDCKSAEFYRNQPAEACSIGTQRTNQLIAQGKVAATEEDWKSQMGWIRQHKCLSHQEFNSYSRR